MCILMVQHGCDVPVPGIPGYLVYPRIVPGIPGYLVFRSMGHPRIVPGIPGYLVYPRIVPGIPGYLVFRDPCMVSLAWDIPGLSLVSQDTILGYYSGIKVWTSRD